jgi:hypothetical protein
MVRPDGIPEDVLSRLLRATGPDRGLDALLDRLAPKRSGYLPRYTGSIDASLGLVERALPGWYWRGGHVPNIHWDNGVAYEHWCHLSRTHASNCDKEDEATGWAHSVPLAILVALVNARSNALVAKAVP